MASGRAHKGVPSASGPPGRYEFDDDSVRQVGLGSVLKARAYMLFYARDAGDLVATKTVHKEEEEEGEEEQEEEEEEEELVEDMVDEEADEEAQITVLVPRGKGAGDEIIFPLTLRNGSCVVSVEVPRGKREGDTFVVPLNKLYPGAPTQTPAEHAGALEAAEGARIDTDGRMGRQSAPPDADKLSSDDDDDDDDDDFVNLMANARTTILCLAVYLPTSPSVGQSLHPSRR